MVLKGELGKLQIYFRKILLHQQKFLMISSGVTRGLIQGGQAWLRGPQTIAQVWDKRS